MFLNKLGLDEGELPTCDTATPKSPKSPAPPLSPITYPTPSPSPSPPSTPVAPLSPVTPTSPLNRLPLNSRLAHLAHLSHLAPMTPLAPPSTPPPLTPNSPFELTSNNFCFRKGPAKSVIYQPQGHPRQAVIDGEIWPPIFKPKCVRSAKKMVVEDSDIFIATYPKCGTTWLQHICHQLIRGENYQTSAGNELCVQSPMIEKMGGEFSASVVRPRILKTHFNRMNVPKNDNAKYIYCVRNPKDCLASYFHHNRNFKIYNYANGTFDTFFDLFLSGQLAFGDYFDHLLTWLPHLKDKNVLFLKYEDMVKDLEGAVRKIGEFLGGDALELVEDADRLRTVVSNSRIDAMKKDQQRWFPEKQLYKSEFIRKGGSRDWINYMNKEQSDRMDDLFRTRTAGTPAEGWWQEEMAWDVVSSIAHLEMEDDFDESVSRRGSFCNNNNEGPKDPHRLLSFRSERRCSHYSLQSSGYGSSWSLSH